MPYKKSFINKMRIKKYYKNRVTKKLLIPECVCWKTKNPV